MVPFLCGLPWWGACLDLGWTLGCRGGTKKGPLA